MIYLNENLNQITHSGWGEFESGFVWSTNRYSSLLMPIDKQDDAFGIQLVVEPFLVDGGLKQQEIEIFCNGLFVLGSVSSITRKEILFFEVHPSLSAFGSLKIDFRFPKAVSPKELQLSDDMRTLGYKFFELQIII